MACVILLATALMNGIAVWVLASPSHRLESICHLGTHLTALIVLSAVCILALRRQVAAIPDAVLVCIVASFCISVGPAVVRGDLGLSALLRWIRRSPASRDALLAGLPMACGSAIGAWLWFSRPWGEQPYEQGHRAADARP